MTAIAVRAMEAVHCVGGLLPIARRPRAWGVSTLVLLSAVACAGCGAGSTETTWRGHGEAGTVASYQGLEHCDQEDVVFLEVSDVDGTQGRRMYVRDPDGDLEEQELDRFRSDAKLPADAHPAGFSSSLGELWFSSSDVDRVAYIVRDSGAHVEAWPRTRSLLGCD